MSRQPLGQSTAPASQPASHSAPLCRTRHAAQSEVRQLHHTPPPPSARHSRQPFQPRARSDCHWTLIHPAAGREKKLHSPRRRRGSAFDIHLALSLSHSRLHCSTPPLQHSSREAFAYLSLPHTHTQLPQSSPAYALR
ncbi:hypothetical protein BCV69DRAFT_199796 [Microstroma glucosiphilum]|uniref:Uncharacterized protein n=1 Tax=Pseudomicrostroma glucosiphilum TaxID=1684307 RepID=A0A316U6D2_9BASI|nr:hypothetical protein BCV69DRAFT_199796 [Pseudomicrostroma glucosiphilum]PWN20806.1 hypothetical protein BCV69DRAFT_199796 [Pseudomicrostroma glucosiphilum]